MPQASDSRPGKQFSVAKPSPPSATGARLRILPRPIFVPSNVAYGLMCEPRNDACDTFEQRQPPFGATAGAAAAAEAQAAQTSWSGAAHDNRLVSAPSAQTPQPSAPSSSMASHSNNADCAVPSAAPAI